MRKVIIGGLYHLVGRFSSAPTSQIMRITGLVEDIPQRVYGVVWLSNGATVRSFDPEKAHLWERDYPVFSCEIGTLLTEAEIAEHRTRAIQRIEEFWGADTTPRAATA